MRLYNQNLYTFFYIPLISIFPASYNILLDLIGVIIRMWRGVQINALLYNFLQPPVTSFLLRMFRHYFQYPVLK
jgi:hypothetical protein